MSLTLITAYTSLRVLAGVASVGYSIYANRVEDSTVDPAAVGTFNFGEIPKAIFGQAVGGIVYDFLKGGTADGIDQYLQRISRIDADALNHDLQRAAQKASLMATYFACQSCLADIKSERQGFLSKAFNTVWKDADTESLNAVSKSLRRQIAEVDKEIFANEINYEELFGIFNETETTTKEKQENLAAELRERTLHEIKTTSYYKFAGHKAVDLTENAFKLLSDAINDGWEKYEEDEPSPIVQLNLNAYGAQIKRYDWFQLLCVIFNEEYKVNERVKAAIEKQTAAEQTASLANQTASLKRLEANIESFGRIENFEKLETQIADFQEENFWLHQITHQKLGTLQESVDRLEAKVDGKIESEPRTVHNLPNLEVKVYGRDVEKDLLLKTLRGETAESLKHPFALIVAPSAFGKTYLLTKALQDVTDGKTIKAGFDDRVKKVLVIDCRQTQNLLQIVGEFNTLFGSKLEFDAEADAVQWLNTYLFPVTHQTGAVWLILDNFESWLDNDNQYQIINQTLRSFLLALSTGSHQIRGAFLSQSEPERDIKSKLDVLDSIGATLFDGLPEDVALEYLRTEGATVNLDQADERLLKEFLRRVAHIPQALTSLISYLSDIPEYTFSEFMADESFWTAFDEDESDATALEKGIRRTKALIARQIKNQSPVIKRLLQALAFFAAPTAREALELLFETKAQAANPISRLHSHHLATVSEDLRGAIYYELHSYFSEQAQIVLAPIAVIATADYANRILIKGNDSHWLNYLAKAISLYESAEKIYQHLFIQGDSAVENGLAMAYVNKGVALANQGRLPEAIVEFDKAIAIRERLVNEEQRGELANDLAAAYMNKGVALKNQGRLPEAIVEFDKAIAIYERLVNEEQRGELANDLVMAYLNKGLAFENLPDLDAALQSFDKGIEWREICLARGEDHILPDYVKDLAHRVRILIKLENYQRTANDVLNAFRFITLLQEPEFPEYFKQRIIGEIRNILFHVVNLSAEKREEIYRHAGEMGDVIRQYVDVFEKKLKTS